MKMVCFFVFVSIGFAQIDANLMDSLFKTQPNILLNIEKIPLKLGFNLNDSIRWSLRSVPTMLPREYDWAEAHIQHIAPQKYTGVGLNALGLILYPIQWALSKWLGKYFDFSYKDRYQEELSDEEKWKMKIQKELAEETDKKRKIE